jgi:hypothetical protein
MPMPAVWSYETFVALSLLILAVAVFLHVRQTRRRLDMIDVEQLARRLNALEEKATESERSINLCLKDDAELKMRTKAVEGDLEEIKEENKRYLSIFKTVLYGFDYIVQGCKSALELGEAEKGPGEKRITGEE